VSHCISYLLVNKYVCVCVCESVYIYCIMHMNNKFFSAAITDSRFDILNHNVMQLKSPL